MDNCEIIDLADGEGMVVVMYFHMLVPVIVAQKLMVAVPLRMRGR